MNRTRLALTALLALVALTACDELLPGLELPFGDKTSPYYWAELYLDVYADELEVGALEPSPGVLEEPRVVLLVTGVTIPAQWFDPIVARLERDGFEPIVYEPPELLSGSLFEASHDLAEVVEQIRADTGQDRIDILAECTAGVIARHYIQSLGGDQTVSRLVTFVSPHNGINKAPLAAAFAGWPALYDLSPGSAFLQAVNSVPLPPNVPVTSIYTCSDEYIQPWQGSIVPGANNIGLCDGFVGHFQTFYDPEIYAIMHTALTEPTGAEPEEEPNDEEPSDVTEIDEPNRGLELVVEWSDDSANEDGPHNEEMAEDEQPALIVDWRPNPAQTDEGPGLVSETDVRTADDEDTAGCNTTGRSGGGAAYGFALLLLLGAVSRQRARLTSQVGCAN